MSDIQAEITYLTGEDLFLLANHKQARFGYPVHFHADYELNLVMNTCGKRLVGDSLENFADIDLVLIGSNLPHAWRAPDDDANHVVNLKFHNDIENSWILTKRLFAPIKEMLEASSRGIQFNPEISRLTAVKLLEMSSVQGFSNAIAFFNILYDLAISRDQRLLASPNYSIQTVVRDSKSRRIQKICEYIEHNYSRNISLKDIADIANMSESAVSHFFKKRTGRNFITYLNDIRIGNASRLLEETTRSISDIAFACGFSNMSNFNQIFKRCRNMSPRQYRLEMHNAIQKY